MRAQDANLYAFPFVHSAGLAELEARWRYEWIIAHPKIRSLCYPNFPTSRISNANALNSLISVPNWKYCSE